mgnify:CR=1 FL=1
MVQRLWWLNSSWKHILATTETDNHDYYCGVTRIFTEGTAKCFVYNAVLRLSVGGGGYSEPRHMMSKTGTTLSRSLFL